MRNGRAFRHAVITEIPFYPWSSLDRVFGKAGIPSAAGRRPGYNFAGWAPAASERLCGVKYSLFNQELIAGVWKEHQKLFAQELPFLPLYFVPRAAATRKGLSNWKERGFGGYGWNVETWSWSK